MSDKLDKSQDYINLNVAFKKRLGELIAQGKTNDEIKHTLETEYPAKIAFITNDDMNKLLDALDTQRFLEILSQPPDEV